MNNQHDDAGLDDATYLKWVETERRNSMYKDLMSRRDPEGQTVSTGIASRLGSDNEQLDVSPERILINGPIKWVWEDTVMLVDNLKKIPTARHYYSIAAGGAETFCAVFLLSRSIRTDEDCAHHVVVTKEQMGIDKWWEYLEVDDPRIVLEVQPASKLTVFDRSVLALQFLDPDDHDQAHVFTSSEKEYTNRVARVAEGRGLKTFKTFLYV